MEIKQSGVQTVFPTQGLLHSCHGCGVFSSSYCSPPLNDNHMLMISKSFSLALTALLCFACNHVWWMSPAECPLGTWETTCLKLISHLFLLPCPTHSLTLSCRLHWICGIKVIYPVPEAATRTSFISSFPMFMLNESPDLRDSAS